MNRSDLIKALTDGYVECASLDVLIECYREQTIEWLSEFSDSELEAEYKILIQGEEYPIQGENK